MPIYGEGECFYDLCEECRMGDSGVEVSPIYCLNCVLLHVGERIAEVLGDLPKEEDDDPTGKELA